MKEPSTSVQTIHRAHSLAWIALAVLSSACETDGGGLGVPGTGSAPGAATANDAGPDAGPGSSADSGMPPGHAGGATASTGGAMHGAMSMTGGPGGTMGGIAPMGGTADGGMSGPRDHCRDGFPADPRDGQIMSQPSEWRASNGAIDLVLPKPVLDWMADGAWTQSHDAWHNIRRCGGGLGGFFGGGAGGFIGGGGGAPRVDVCAQTELVPEDQECENASDGYQFLVMHRHMIQGLKQAFPAHADLFKGFPKFPFQATDVPMQWQARWGTGWSQQILQVANVLEAVEQNLSQFPTEGDLGRYIQCGAAGGASSIHGALHFKWVVMESPHSLGNQAVNIENYMFWKLHGWIDDIWERYRIAKGLSRDEPKLKQALYDQCYEMHQLGQLFGSSVPLPGSGDPLPAERGYFHEMVRPILDKQCMGCHSGTGPQGNLLLGGQVSSATIVQNLVNTPTLFGGQFKRVVPGNPSQSWLYLKVSGMASSAGCTGTMCSTGVMPPTGEVTLTAAELEVIRKWIADGAPAPTQ